MPSMPQQKQRQSDAWVFPLLIVITVLLGTQLLRANLAYFRWLFGDRFLWSSLQLGGLGLGIYSLVVLVGPLLRRMGTRPLLLRAAFIVGSTRLLAQIWWGDPLVDALLVIVGVLAFLVFLPVALGWMVGDRIHRPEAGWRFGLIFLSGLALDGAIHGLFLTYDPIWQTNWVSLLITLALVAGQWWLQWMINRRPAVPLPFRETNLRNSLPLLFFGPFLVYYLIVGGNLARLMALTDWPLPLGLLVLLAGQLAAIFLAWLLPPGRAVALLAFVLLMVTINPLFLGAEAAAIALVISQVSVGLLVVSACTHMARNRDKQGVGHTARLWWASTTLFVLLIFLYYATYELSIPFSRETVIYLVAVAMGASLLFSLDRWAVAFTTRPASDNPSLLNRSGLPALSMMAFVLIFMLALTTVIWQQPGFVSANSTGQRIVDYNIHNGFTMAGTLDLEALAQMILSQQADIVAVQEVSRGWVINGSVDMATWLSWRLGMPATFSPTSGADWGHAIFTRYPVLRHDEFSLPPPGLPLMRGFAYHELDVGDEKPLLLINTHLHHVTEDAAIREQQVAAILHFLEGSPIERLVVTGDLNAEPSEAAMLGLKAIGLWDVIEEAGLQPGFTFPADVPAIQIDYILVSPDIRLRSVEVFPQVISDHLGIGATISLR